ncbi:MAG: decarboxylating 6-phosphogluconate dehydrogenase [Chloroflexi bacterium]|nr:decarboxylating 6-phosphogluconate dehydrogenase [Chloroflexota bacterium]
MQIGMAGLGRMGGAMARRLLRNGHEVVAYNRSPKPVADIVAEGARGADSLHALVEALTPPRAVWTMVPSGDATEAMVNALLDLLSPGDTLIEGANSNFRDSQRRARAAADRRLLFLDAGTSGGIWGLEGGYCMMVGGDREAYDRLLPALKSLAPGEDRGYAYMGPAGAGHFVKMVHNGIEYGMMQAFAEGFEMLEAKKEFGLNMAEIAELWRHGSVVRSWLLDLAAAAFQEDPGLDNLVSYVDDSGEGRWTVQESVELAVPTPVITAALQQRFRSRQVNPLGGRVLAALRNQFGGHAVYADKP